MVCYLAKTTQSLFLFFSEILVISDNYFWHSSIIAKRWGILVLGNLSPSEFEQNGLAAIGQRMVYFKWVNQAKVHH